MNGSSPQKNSQKPLPQAHSPQSCWQLKKLSLQLWSQKPSPQAQAPLQSNGHENGSSKQSTWQVPSPHWQKPQSFGQVSDDSPQKVSQAKLPHAQI